MTLSGSCPRPAPNWWRVAASGGIQWQTATLRLPSLSAGQARVLAGVRGAPGRIRTCGTRFRNACPRGVMTCTLPVA
jgi:hypothetical protein